MPGTEIPEDEKLLARIEAGEREAFDFLIEKYRREIYFLVFRMVNNREDSEELAQQIFVKTFQNLEKFRGDSSFKTWLFQIAINQCRTFTRREKPTLELNEEVICGIDEAGDRSPLGSVLKKEAVLTATEAIKCLPEKQRIIVTLRIFNEMSYREIGKIADCSEETAKVNFHYGMENLRKKMKENGLL